MYVTRASFSYALMFTVTMGWLLIRKDLPSARIRWILTFAMISEVLCQTSPKP